MRQFFRTFSCITTSSHQFNRLYKQVAFDNITLEMKYLTIVYTEIIDASNNPRANRQQGDIDYKLYTKSKSTL